MDNTRRASAAERFDWQWARATGGNLSRADRRRMLAPIVRGVPRLAREWTSARTGRRGTAKIELGQLGWPDSQLARAAEAEARATLSVHVLEHSYRSYLFGLVLAGIDGAPVDREAAFTTCMLHDVQLESPTPGRCFAVVGAERAEHFTRAHGADSELATRIAAGIAAHLTPGVADDMSDLAGFVSAGALVDVVGARLQEMDPAWVREVLARHPRHDFKRTLLAALDQECQAVPDGRISWLSRRAGFPLMIKAAPFES